MSTGRKQQMDIMLPANASYNITKKLTFKTTFGYETTKLVDRQFSDSLTSFSRLQGSSQPVIQIRYHRKDTITNSNVLRLS